MGRPRRRQQNARIAPVPSLKSDGLGELDPFRGLTVPSGLAKVQVAGAVDVKFVGQASACRGRALAI